MINLAKKKKKTHLRQVKWPKLNKNPCLNNLCPNDNESCRKAKEHIGWKCSDYNKENKIFLNNSNSISNHDEFQIYYWNLMTESTRMRTQAFMLCAIYKVFWNLQGLLEFLCLCSIDESCRQWFSGHQIWPFMHVSNLLNLSYRIKLEDPMSFWLYCFDIHQVVFSN